MRLFEKSFSRRRGDAEVGAKAVKRASIFLILALLASFLFFGCEEPKDDGNLNGTWINNYQNYITTIKIDTLENTIKYENNYEGTIVNPTDYETKNGVLIIEFTKYWVPDYSNFPETTYTETNTYNGKYGALYWKDLRSNSVYMADAYDGYNHKMFSTPEDALTNFSMNNVGNYIDWSIVGLYTK